MSTHLQGRLACGDDVSFRLPWQKTSRNGSLGTPTDLAKSRWPTKRNLELNRDKTNWLVSCQTPFSSCGLDAELVQIPLQTLRLLMHWGSEASWKQR